MTRRSPARALALATLTVALVAGRASAQPAPSRGGAGLEPAQLADYMKALTALDAVAQMRFGGELREGLQVDALQLEAHWRRPASGGAPVLTSLTITPVDPGSGAEPEWMERVRRSPPDRVELPGLGRIAGVRRVIARPDRSIVLDVSGFDYIVHPDGRIKRGTSTLREPPGKQRIGGVVEKVSIDERGQVRLVLRKQVGPVAVPFVVRITRVEREANGDLRLHTAPALPDIRIRKRDGVVSAWGKELFRCRTDLSQLGWPPRLDELAALATSAPSSAPAAAVPAAPAGPAAPGAKTVTTLSLRYDVRAIVDPSKLDRRVTGRASLAVLGEVALGPDGARTTGRNNRIVADVDVKGRDVVAGPVSAERAAAAAKLRGTYGFDTRKPGAGLDLDLNGSFDLSAGGAMGVDGLDAGGVKVDDLRGRGDVRSRGTVHVTEDGADVTADASAKVAIPEGPGIVDVLMGRDRVRVRPSGDVAAGVDDLRVRTRRGAAPEVTVAGATVDGRVRARDLELDTPDLTVRAPDSTATVALDLRGGTARGKLDVTTAAPLDLGYAGLPGAPVVAGRAPGERDVRATIAPGASVGVEVDAARFGPDGVTIDGRTTGTLTLTSSELRHGDLRARILGAAGVSGASFHRGADGLRVSVPIDLTLGAGSVVALPGLADPLTIDREGSRATFTAVVTRGPDGAAKVELTGVDLRVASGGRSRIALGGPAGSTGLEVEGVKTFRLTAGRITADGRGLELYDGELLTGVRSERPDTPYLKVAF